MKRAVGVILFFLFVTSIPGLFAQIPTSNEEKLRANLAEYFFIDHLLIEGKPLLTRLSGTGST